MASTKFDALYDGPEAESSSSRSFSRWQTAFQLAESMLDVPENSFHLKQVLSRTPSLPDTIPSDSTWIEGYSTWKNSDILCPLTTKTESVQRLFLRKRHLTLCTVSTSQNFVTWNGTPNNGVLLLALGWSYILCVSLAERQNLRLKYSLEAQHSPTSHQICLDYATSQEITWWKALLGRGLVWSVAGNQILPWALRADNVGLDIRGGMNVSQQPPTAEQAARYLARLCHTFELGTQCSAALAAALCVPLHASMSFFGAVTIELPPASLTVRLARPNHHQDCPADFEFLVHYMALSLDPQIYGSCLWSVFWEPDILCNSAGAWLEPIGTTLEPIIHNNNLELLAKVLSSGEVAPLWLGLTLCGRQAVIRSILPSLTELRDYLHRRPNIDSAAWTGKPQSFMDIHPVGPYLRDGLVLRADVWRLRHDFHMEYPDNGFSFTPPYGWAPFGSMRAEDVELEIRGHLNCSHQWKYEYWTWLPDNIRDVGFSRNGEALPPRQFSINDERPQRSRNCEVVRRISRTATEAIFWWCCSQVEMGFGGALVPYRSKPDEILDSTESGHSLNDKAIGEWLETTALDRMREFGIEIDYKLMGWCESGDVATFIHANHVLTGRNSDADRSMDNPLALRG